MVGDREQLHALLSIINDKRQNAVSIYELRCMSGQFSIQLSLSEQRYYLNGLSVLHSHNDQSGSCKKIASHCTSDN